MKKPSASLGVPQTVLSFLMLGGASAAIYGLLWFIDLGGVPGADPLTLMRSPGAVDAMLSFTEVTVGVLGIAITVVAIIVELAANRYTPRITELFLSDPVNMSTMGFFVVTSVVVLWVDMSLFGGTHPPTMALVATALMTTSLLALLPYFAYVFRFLTPTQVIWRIQDTGSGRLHRLGRGSERIEDARAAVVLSIEQLGDIALNSVDKKDKPLTLSAIGALAEVAKTAIATKASVPTPWFDTRPLAVDDQDFIALHDDMVSALTERRTWVEMKIFRQYQGIFGEAVNRMRDVNHLIAIHTRQIALTALKARDVHALRLSLRFQNTYLRNAVNARDVRTAYNILNEYRLFAESALEEDSPETVLEVANYIKFYGQLAFATKIAFILETAAYDLCSLLERAHGAHADCHDQLLSVFLDVDREPDSDGKGQEASLRGVRKAQIKLATYYLEKSDEKSARRIFEDMKHEKLDRLHQIRAELEAVKDAEYWEVSDRGINFEWLPESRRALLPTFFGWFEGL